MEPEVIRYGNRFRIVAHSEHGIASACGAQLLDDNHTIPTSMDSLNPHVGYELLQTNPISVRKAALGRKGRGILFFEEFHEKVDKWSWPVHYPRCDVDVQVHSVLGRTDGLKVSPP